ncbi:MAG TPA: LysE family transporter, partial [Polyangiaceae bacterium]|nr:LysE family transporter [Polyangiaceae bacterium]
MHLLVVCAIAFAFAFVGSMPLVGPIALLTVSRAAHKRFGEALRIGLGAAAAEALYASLAFWGFATVLSRYRLVIPISRGATGVVLT